MATLFANPEKQFQTRSDTPSASIHNIYTFYEYESSESESEDVGKIDIETLTLEQYLTFNNTRRRISNPENATFEIKGQFLRELRKTTFSGSSTENAIEHIRKVLEVASMFNTNDPALLQVFPLTVVGVAKRWFDRTSSEHVKNWDEIKQNFIRGFYPPAMILEQLGEICNFKPEDGESLFNTWERYNDLLFKCPFHDLNDHQKLNTFYNGLKDHTRRIIDSNGLIPGLTASEALKSIQELDDHSHKWYNEERKKYSNSIRYYCQKTQGPKP
ncbi:homeodomain-like protein [Tanacetum coccineum]